MTDTPFPLAGGDAHGDSTPDNQIPPRSSTTGAESTIPSPAPDAPAFDPQVHSNLTTGDLDTREIEPVLGQVQTPAVGSSKVAAASPSAERLPLEDPHQLPGRHPPDQQAGTAAKVFLPDLAQEIQLQESFNSKCRGSGQEGNHAEEGEDPLILDLIQRCINREILHDPPVGEIFIATSIQGATVMQKEKTRCSSSEKGKRVQSEATLGRHQSSQLKKATLSSLTADHKLQQGECSTAWEVRSPQSPLFQYPSGLWRGEQKQQQKNFPIDSCDEQGFHEAKSAYWWRYSNSRDKLQPQQSKGDEQRRQRYLAHVKGKCLNCFSTEHRVVHCRNNTKCWKCLKPGHKAFSCPSWGSRFKHPHKKKPDPDSLGEKRSSQEDANGRDVRPHWDDLDDDCHSGTKHHFSHTAWGRVPHYRDTAKDCYNSSSYLWCDSHYGQSRYHSRHFSSPPHWGIRGTQKKGNKHVAFANPLAQVLGEAFVSRDDSCFLQTTTFCHEVVSTRFDPMCEELLISPTLVRTQTKEDCIRSMLRSPGWEPVASPERVEVVSGASSNELEEGEIMDPTARGAVKDKAHEEADHEIFSTTNETIQVCTQKSAALISKPVSMHGLDHTLEELEIAGGESFNCNAPPPLQTTSITHFDDIAHDHCTHTSPIDQSSVEEVVEVETDRERTSLHVTHIQTQPVAPTPTQQVDPDQFQNQVVNTPCVQQPPITEVSNSGRDPNGPTLNNGEGKQIDDFAAFIDFISGPPPAAILNTPPRVNPPQPVGTQPESTTTQRKSTRLAEKAKLYPGEDSVQLAQRVLINKLGELSPKKKVQAQLDFNTLAQHLPQPLTRTNMEAIQTLIEQGNQPKRKKRAKVVPAPAAEIVDQMT
ncbi:unnamed protein product [Urochloa humidicola]